MKAWWVIIRILAAAFFVLCGMAPATFLIMLFGVNSRTATLGVMLIAGTALVGCAADRAIRDESGERAGADVYLRRMNRGMILLGVILGGAFLFFAGLVIVAAIRSVRS